MTRSAVSSGAGHLVRIPVWPGPRWLMIYDQLTSPSLDLLN